jgi:DNA polymerase-1
MQTTGKHFYVEEAKKIMQTNSVQMEELRWDIKRIAGIKYRFNPNSREHLIDLIHNRLKIPVEFYTQGKTPKPAMDKKALKSYFEEYKSPALTKLQKNTRLQKQNTEIESLLNWVDENNRTHSNLNITGTRETRQSSTAPNDQNTDNELKHLFGPPPGKVWICTDLVNIELRIWSYVIGNKELIALFEQGKSVHQIIMEIIFPEEAKLIGSIKDKPKKELTDSDYRILKKYTNVKAGNFSLLYGGSENKINESYHGGKNAPNYCARINAKFPGVIEFTKTRMAMALENYAKYKVYSVTTLGGYRLDVDPEKPYTACNYYVQGSAGWLMTEAMIAWDAHPDYRRYNCAMNSQIHDGLDTEVAITPALPRIIDAKCMVISRAGCTYIPTCDVTWELKYHPSDETNPIIQEILQSK